MQYTELGGKHACRDCDAGFYSSQLASVTKSVCTVCPTATYSAFVGAGSLVQCNACPVKTNSPVASTVASSCRCNAGHTGQACAACVEGTYKEVMGSAGCSACAPGNFLGQPGADSASICTSCPDYSHSPKANTSCKCNVGYEGPRDGPCTALRSYYSKELDEDQSYFNALANGDGFVTGPEWANALSVQISECEASVYLLDTNGDATMDFEEWRAGGNRKREGDVLSVMTLMYYASMNIDESSQGLESSELAAFMLTHSVDNFQEAISFIAQVDISKDGQVTIYEFNQHTKAIFGSFPFYSVNLERTEFFNLNYCIMSRLSKW